MAWRRSSVLARPCSLARDMPVGCPVVLHDVGVIDRHVGRTLLEVLHRVTALSHDVQDECVRLVDGLARSVHEPLLRGPPGDDVALAALRSERPYFHALTPLPPRRELRLGIPALALLPDRPVVLRPELALQPMRATPAPHRPTDSDEGEHADGGDDPAP